MSEYSEFCAVRNVFCLIYRSIAYSLPNLMVLSGCLNTLLKHNGDAAHIRLIFQAAIAYTRRDQLNID